MLDLSDVDMLVWQLPGYQSGISVIVGHLGELSVHSEDCHAGWIRTWTKPRATWFRSRLTLNRSLRTLTWVEGCEGYSDINSSYGNLEKLTPALRVLSFQTNAV